MEYDFRRIEKEWQKKWKESGVYKVSNDSSKPKCYVLDMFPYPSGAGLHVGHPLGYIASDIYARYKRLKGFNVLHPMGYDAFGLPAEQYAIDHGIHPAVSTENNINNFRKQLDNIGFSYDWDREVRTCDPKFYKWTQWIFLQLFDSFYNRKKNKAEPISNLIAAFEKEGNSTHPIPDSHSPITSFTAADWRSFDEAKQQSILMDYRLAYCGIGEVNWCEALGTVLANDEVINGVSERGGYPVVKKKLRQWYLRITEYADRLLEGLQKVDFSESMKEMQTNWIGKSEGAEIEFRLTPNPSPGGEGNNVPPGLSGKFFKTADRKKWAILKDLSRENRKNKTEAEDILWQEIRNNKLGYKVRRQHVIEGFIIDFAILEKRMLIEVDGSYHEDEEQKKYDEARTEYLQECGYKILRFTNDEVKNEIRSVLKRIKEELDQTVIEGSVTPLSERRGSGGEAQKLKVYTTRPDTIFGVDFMVIAPEHEMLEEIVIGKQKADVEKYLDYVNSRSERERMAEKKITGVFTGSYCVHPFSNKKIPIWISEYVLIGYGTGAIMGVPCGDERDHKFAKHFNIPITNIIGSYYNGEEANDTKDAVLENSDFLNGMVMKDAIEVAISKIEELGIGKRKVNYKMRDAAFSRQRYWGEPFPIVWKNGVAYPLPENELPVILPEMKEIKPGPDGEGPLANLEEWVNLPSPTGEGSGVRREVNTMPGYAGSSWYFLRYMDPHNEKEFCDRKASDYWNQVDLYIGGTEHAVGHLLYSRMWTKFLYDRSWISYDEPYKKLVNQGMIQGKSFFVDGDMYIDRNDNKEVSDLIVYLSSFQSEKEFQSKINREDIVWEKEDKKYPGGFRLPNAHRYLDAQGRLTESMYDLYKKEQGHLSRVFKQKEIHVDWSKEDKTESGEPFLSGVVIEKMSKSKFNVDNPDEIVEQHGADTFRMYEMFLGPVEMSKPWDTKGIEGVHRFLKKFWRLFFDEVKGPIWTTVAPSPSERAGGEVATDAELKVLHKAIKKIEEDTERFSFNTAVSAFMIATNELTDLKCHKKEILEPLVILLAPYAPHICEELWHLLGHTTSVVTTGYPKWEEKWLAETSKEYPISVNGKLRTHINITLDASQDEVEKIVLSNEVVQKWLDCKPHKKIIYVKGKMVNVVV